jgi:hypothetical protein
MLESSVIPSFLSVADGLFVHQHSASFGAVFAQSVTKKPHIALNGGLLAATTYGLPEAPSRAYMAVAPTEIVHAIPSHKPM